MYLGCPRSYQTLAEYGYDAGPGGIGRRTSISNTHGQTQWLYDANGNMTQRVEISGSQRITYTQEWDVENKLVAVTNTVTGQVTRFYRDADGNLVKKSDGAGTVMIVNAIFEHITTTNQSTSYYLFGGQRVAMRTSGAVYWLHGDHLGSASLTTNVSGQKVSELRYLPFGETRWAWGRTVSATTPTDRRYTGQRELAGVGLYDYNARMYAPGLGRFISADTIVPRPGDPQSLNRYSYVRNSPIVHIDPSGHADTCNAALYHCGGSSTSTPKFTKLPVGKAVWFGFGNIKNAKNNNAYKSTSYLHGGIDLRAPAGTPVVAGLEGVYVGAMPGDASSHGGNVVIRVGGYYVIYGHTIVNPDLKLGQEVGPDTVIGSVGKWEPDNHHVHLVVRERLSKHAEAEEARRAIARARGERVWNPLLFFPAGLQSVPVDARSSAYEGAYHALSMTSFNYATLNYWEYSRDRSALPPKINVKWTSSSPELLYPEFAIWR